MPFHEQVAHCEAAQMCSLAECVFTIRLDAWMPGSLGMSHPSLAC